MDGVTIVTNSSQIALLIYMILKLYQNEYKLNRLLVDLQSRMNSLEKRIFTDADSLANRITRLENILLENKQNKRKRKKSNE